MADLPLFDIIVLGALGLGIIAVAVFCFLASME